MAKLLAVICLTLLVVALCANASPIIEDVTVVSDEGAHTTEEASVQNDGAETTYGPSYDDGVTGGKGLNLERGDETTTGQPASANLI